MLLAATLLAGCARTPEPVGLSSQADVAPAQPEDDGLPDRPDPVAMVLAGAYSLWEDTEGGTVCPIELHAVPVLGGHALDVDAACVASLGLEGEPYAWFVDGRDASLVIVDATRRAVVRLPHFHGAEFYLPKDPTRRYGLMLNPRR